MKPKAREERLKIEVLPDETVVVDLKRNKAHCLNKTATVVWGYCDGNTTLSEMIKRLHEDLGAPRPAALVRVAIRQLQRADLLEPESVSRPSGKLVTRREVARAMSASAAWLVPAVNSLALPTVGKLRSKQR